MNNIIIPSISVSYIEQKVYNICISPDITVPPVTIVAPDVMIAVQVFSRLYPSNDIVNIVCCGPCVSSYPLSPSHE